MPGAEVHCNRSRQFNFRSCVTDQLHPLYFKVAGTLRVPFAIVRYRSLRSANRMQTALGKCLLPSTHTIIRTYPTMLGPNPFESFFSLPIFQTSPLPFSQTARFSQVTVKNRPLEPPGRLDPAR